LPEPELPEPWLRGTLTQVPAVPRAVLHALELAREDVQRFCSTLTDEELNARPAGLPPVAFHLKHIARSLDRLLTYAEGRNLTDEQVAAGKSELESRSTGAELFAELNAAWTRSAARILALDLSMLGQPRTVGRKQLPTTLAGLLVHTADHTQRHAGQVVTTAKLLLAQRS
jgi:uncharacterized damage-inducible protein DinB